MLKAMYIKSTTYWHFHLPETVQATTTTKYPGIIHFNSVHRSEKLKLLSGIWPCKTMVSWGALTDTTAKKCRKFSTKYPVFFCKSRFQCHNIQSNLYLQKLGEASPLSSNNEHYFMLQTKKVLMHHYKMQQFYPSLIKSSFLN